MDVGQVLSRFFLKTNKLNYNISIELMAQSMMCVCVSVCVRARMRTCVCGKRVEYSGLALC